MGGLAVKTDGGRNTGCHVVTLMDTQQTDLQCVLAMGAEYPAHALHNARIHQHLGTADSALLAGLENQTHTILQFLLMGLQVLCCRQHHGGMGIVTAGMHDAGDL